jgi:hypothetical protein
MNARRVLILIASAGAVHNILRLVASAAGAPWGFFNYLHPFHLELTGSALAASAAGLLVAGFGLIVAWQAWNRPNAPNSAASPMLSSVLWTLPTAALASAFAVMCASADRSYGWAMFVLVPFLTGFHATLALSRKKQLTLGDAMAASLYSILLLGGLLMAAAVEGFICLAMAAPLAVPLAMLGGLVGLWIAGTKRVKSPVAFLMIIGLTPFGATVEHRLQPPASVFQVTTSIDLEASPERVWQTVLQPATLAAPTHPLLRAGVGYPQASHIEGAGASAIRYCDFSTGKLVEPVLIWNEPRQLRFTVASSPIPMQEWTPYAHLHPPHLDGFLVTRQGEFRLTPLSDGGTRLEASTWYQHHLWPEQYWRWWSDDIIHGIHQMVLTNIRDRATVRRLQ